MTGVFVHFLSYLFFSLVLKYDLPHIYIKGNIFPEVLIYYFHMTQGGLYDYVKPILYL